MTKPRDHHAEYARRLERAFARGLSRAQARGHARPGEARLRPAKPADVQRLEAAYKHWRRTGNQRDAAKAVRISAERLRRYVRENALAEREGRHWKFTDHRLREMTVLSGSGAHQVKLGDFDQASLNGQHLAAVRAFLSSNDIELLAPFEGKSVIDAKGKAFPLETNPNALHRLAAAGDDVFHEIYRLII